MHNHVVNVGDSQAKMVEHDIMMQIRVVTIWFMSLITFHNVGQHAGRRRMWVTKPIALQMTSVDRVRVQAVFENFENK